MASTFYGFEIAKSALQASQMGLNVVGQNVANINTEDYTRQVLDVNAANYSSGADRYAQLAWNNIGQGVELKGITQVRDALVDAEVRTANSNYSTWEVTSSTLSDVETVLDESTADGLHAMFTDFYNQLEGLSNNTGDIGYATIARSSAEKVTQVFNQYAKQLSQIRSQLNSDLSISVQEVNTTVDKLNEINALIKDQAVRGAVSNELLDTRNGYIDTLSGYMDITVTPNADSTVSVTTTGGADLLASSFSVTESGGITSIIRTEAGTDTAFSPDSGSLKGYLQMLNGAGVYDTANSYKGLAYYEKALDSLASSFATEFNAINSSGGTALPLFEGTTAADIAISEEWLADADYIVTGVTGTNDNVIKMINLMDNDTVISPYFTGSFEEASRSLMSEINVEVGYVSDMKDMYGRILSASTNERESIVGVSINEETTNLMKYQKAYQAAARVMTALDEALDVLINKTGIVGR